MTLNVAVGLRESTRRTPEKVALIQNDASFTYAQVHAAAQRFAGGLRNLGVKPGEHVALLLPNVPHFTIAYYGGHYAATPIVPLNVLLTADEIAFQLDDSDAMALVAWEGFLPQAQAAIARVPRCRHLIVASAGQGPSPDGTASMDVMLKESPPVLELPLTAPDDTAVILYTSGTTGRPKGAELTHFNLFYNAEYSATRLVPMASDEVALLALPLFHSFGQTVVQNATLRAGGTLVLMARFDPKGALELMRKHRVTFFAGVPTMYFALLHFPEADQYDLSGLRYCISGGAPMPVEVMKTFDAKYGVNILEGYGLSETSPAASFNTLDRPKKSGSIGMPIWGVEFKLVDEAGNDLEKPDEPGEICISGHNVMKGYYKRAEESAEAFRGGWFHTGDIAVRDADGYYFIVDRKKDMIIRGGFKVYPREVEEVLYAHPAVAEAAVVGVADPALGEEVKAFVVLKAGVSATAEELIDYAKGKLGAYKWPRVVEFREALPKGSTGKILKRALRS